MKPAPEAPQLPKDLRAKTRSELHLAGYTLLYASDGSPQYWRAPRDAEQPGMYYRFECADG